MKFSIAGREIGDDCPCFTIAEIGINFNGSLDTAKRLIDAAVAAGCDAAKFQAFSADNIYPKTAGTLDWEDNEKKYSYSIHENVKKFELPKSWVPELKRYCDEKRIIFFSSICDEEQADYYDSLGVPLFKTTSYAVTHLPLIEYIAKKGKPIIISTGGSDLQEVKEAYEAARKYNGKIILLHCVIKYGAALDTINMNVLDTLKTEFPDAVIGYSDHTYEAVDTPVAAVYKGAKVVEKHITLDRKMPGPDHFFALEPAMLKEMVTAIKDTERKMNEGKPISINPIILGSGEKKMQSNEEYLRKFAFRTIITSKAISKGETINLDNVKVLRPGKLEKGLEPKELPKITDGSYKTKDNLAEGTVITWKNIEGGKMNINNKELQQDKAYIIAEIASAHCGDINKLKQIIKSCVDSGVDAVKFQMFDVDYFVSVFHPNYPNNKKNQFSKETWEEIFSYTKQFNVDVWADVFDEGSADLAEQHVHGFKLHSTDVTNPFMIRHVAKKGKPIILAAGGATLQELKNAVKMIEEAGNCQIILSHGFQAYPTSIENVNLKRLNVLREEFPQYTIGYHDHTDAEMNMAKVMPLAAFAYGARVIEKHVTDDRSLKGFDYESSLNPDELKEMVQMFQTFESSLGSDGFEMSEAEMKYKDYTKRYVVAKRPIMKSETITKEDLAFKRSTHGITPREYEKVVGRKAARDLKQDESITMADIENKVAICLAVRLKSTRLPKKALLEIDGQTFIEHQIDRIRRCKNGELILCTSDLEEDSLLIEIAKRKGVKWFAGSADDVMDRFMKAAEKENANIIVRTTGDNPLQDPELIDQQIEFHIKEGADYTGIEDLPIGFEAEVVNMWTLKDAHSRVKDIKETEFMTWFIKDPKHFKVMILPVDDNLKRKYRVTLDTPEDQKVISSVFDALYPQNKTFGVKEVVNFLDNNIEIASINVDYEQIKRPPKLKEMNNDTDISSY
ncbi:hypothetical protein COV20_03835 [Candidatus Woesearchaeota archaeon CG10_big_fil_rev_8_21_14_0_10_45_16]|nr:MAG: hypothetical protein COV20_03835 [Candidatus Woesearchaeota archaeon CG10_big_fil_rev_8_21_14_0_10_45_16]